MNKDEDLRSNYANAYNGHLSLGNMPALLIIDFVMAYLDPVSPLYAGVEAELVSNQKMLVAARNAKIPVIFTNIVYKPGGSDGGLFYKKVPALKVFDKGSPLGAFSPELKPRQDELVLSKQFPSAFFKTRLDMVLKGNGIDTLLITGLSTSGCVRASALDALQHGYAPFVVREACGDRHQAPHEANLFDLQAKYAEIISEKTALAYLQAI